MELHREHGHELKRMNSFKRAFKVSKNSGKSGVHTDRKYVKIPAPDFPAIHSTIIAIVIREGKP